MYASLNHAWRTHRTVSSDVSIEARNDASRSAAVTRSIGKVNRPELICLRQIAVEGEPILRTLDAEQSVKGAREWTAPIRRGLGDRSVDLIPHDLRFGAVGDIENGNASENRRTANKTTPIESSA